MSKNTKALETLSSAMETLLFAVEEINRAVSQLSVSKKTEEFQNSFNGEVEIVTEEVEANARKARGTKVRQENKELLYELVEECAKKKLLPIKPQQGINEGILGMEETKYKKYFGVPKQLNCNLSVDQVSAKNMAMIMATAVIRHYEKPTISQPDGVIIGRNAALHARVILSGKLSASIEQEADKLKEQDKINEKRIAKDFRAGKRPSLPD